ncbi:MAG: efflux RND transporter periplasmic adaptor subunit [Bacteroidales bacterium]|nr:efflux RND transporter periplasmic adaptor subunit [Bacteroidales bacterium]
MNRLLLLAAVTLVAGCAGHGSHSESEEHGHHHHGSEIVFSEEQQKRFDIKTEKAVPSPYCEIIKTSGEILPAQGDEATIVATVAGTVEFSRKANIGSRVLKGEAVASICSRNLASGDQYLKAKATYEAAKKEYERDVELLKNDIVSESHHDQSKLAYEQAKAEYEALARNASESGVKAVAPFSGFITSLLAKQGEYVEVGQPVATVSQNIKMQLLCNLPERYASSLGDISDATFRCADGTVLSVKENGGRILNYGTSVSSGYIPVYFEFNKNSSAIQGSFVEVCLKGRQTEDKISIPESALTEDQGIFSVFVRLDEDCFAKKEVKILSSDGIRAAVSGLEEGDEVVTEGAMHIKLASVSAVPSGHNHNH